MWNCRGKYSHSQHKEKNNEMKTEVECGGLFHRTLTESCAHAVLLLSAWRDLMLHFSQSTCDVGYKKENKHFGL